MTTTDSPQAQADQAQRKLAAVRGARRWIKRARWVLAACLLLIGGYAALSYRAYTLPATAAPPVHGLEAGDVLLLQVLNFGREPRLGDIVIYRHAAATDGAPESLIGRVVGLPAESVARQGPLLKVGSRPALEAALDILPDAPVKAGDVIPDGRYLIIADHAPGAYLDSRDIGYVAVADIQRRVVLNFSAWSGRAATP